MNRADEILPRPIAWIGMDFSRWDDWHFLNESSDRSKDQRQVEEPNVRSKKPRMPIPPLEERTIEASPKPCDCLPSHRPANIVPGASSSPAQERAHPTMPGRIIEPHATVTLDLRKIHPQ